MSEFEQTRLFWENEIVKGNLIWPDEFVIRFVKRNYKESDGTVILDFGCGAGRNAIALAKEGYKIVAMDYTDHAIEMIHHKKGNLPIRAVKNVGFEVPLEAESVDAIIADGSLFYNSISDTTKILSNLKKALKRGGKIWVNWRSVEDSMYSKGIKLGDGLFKLDDSTQRDGCSYLFCDKAAITEMYERAGFIITAIDDYTYTENNGSKLCAYYHVIAMKE